MRPETHETLKELAAQARVPVTQVVDRLAAEERRRVRLQECNEAFVRLRADPVRWAAYQAEREVFEGTVGDGLDEWDADADAEHWEPAEAE